MPNYIDRDALKRDLIDRMGFYPTFVKNALENAPVLVVVRCGECRHFRKDASASNRVFGECKFKKHITTTHDFCSYGECDD